MTSSKVISGFGWIAAALAFLTLWPLVKLLHDRAELPLLIGLPLVVGVIGAGVGSALAYGYRKARFKPQQRLNREAHEAHELVEKELQTLLVQIRNLALEDEQRSEFEEAHGYWEKFRDAQAAFEAAEVKGGTLWPLLFYTTMEAVTRERLESLRKSYNYLAEYHTPAPDGAPGQQQREDLRRRLDGHWEYVCRVTSPASFEDNVVGRGGIMTISVSLHWTAVTAGIVAERLWETTSREDTPGDRKPLTKSIQWNADGAVIFDGDRLSFEYFSGDGRGITKGTFQLLEEANTLYVGLGTFKHQRVDGQHVEGTVQLRKMRHYADFKWAPSGINWAGTVAQSSDTTDGGQPRPNVAPREPRRRQVAVNLENAGVVTIGDVSEGTVTSTMMELPLAPGDSTSLAKVLRQIAVPTEDISQIKEIVESEKPNQGTIGPRAAGWVGSMVTKSLTGAWEVGRGISSTALSEIILRFYGLR